MVAGDGAGDARPGGGLGGDLPGADGLGAGLDAGLGVGLGVGLGGGLGGRRLETAERLRRQRAVLSRLLDEFEGAIALVPSDAGRFWRSDAQRAYAARLHELRRLLGHARAGLHAALSSTEAALAALLSAAE